MPIGLSTAAATAVKREVATNRFGQNGLGLRSSAYAGLDVQERKFADELVEKIWTGIERDLDNSIVLRVAIKAAIKRFARYVDCNDSFADNGPEVMVILQDVFLGILGNLDLQMTEPHCDEFDPLPEPARLEVDSATSHSMDILRRIFSKLPTVDKRARNFASGVAGIVEKKNGIVTEGKVGVVFQELWLKLRKRFKV